ncbi:hypothetical protein, partial [Thiolapillus sp.]|uniref:hypothetical protein n=4 Tax=Thiolapillus sp. TaxID=2017437 RepID=UPI003AF56F99
LVLDTFEEKGWMLADHPALGQERPDIAVDSACWHPPAADGIRKPCAPANNIQRHDSWFPSRGLTVIRNATFPTPAGSPQVVPDPTTTAVLIQNAALNQRPCVFHPNVTADSKENPGISHVGVEYAPPPFQARELKSAKNEIVGINKASIPLPAFSGEGTQKREK